MNIKLFSVILCTVSALFFNQSSAAQQKINEIRGIDLKNAIFLEVALPENAYSVSQRGGFVRQVIKRIESLSQVASAAVADTLPSSNSNESRTLYAEGAATPYVTTYSNVITPDYFRAVRIPLLKGRSFKEGDQADSVPVVILSESVAGKLYPDEEPIGKLVSISNASGKGSWMAVTGVVGDVRDATGKLLAGIYIPYSQNPSSTLNIIVRCNSQSNQFVEKLKEEIQAIDSQLVVSEIKN